MPEQTFGQLVRAAREAKRWSRSDLGVELGRINGKTFGDSKVQRLENDWQVHKAPALVRRLVEVLGLDPAMAWGLAYPETAAALLAILDESREVAAGAVERLREAVAAVNPKRNSVSYSLYAAQRAA